MFAKSIAASLAALLVLAPSAAFAGSDTDSFQVTATVLASCDVTASNLTFGNYNPVTASHLDAATTLSVTCTNGTAYNVGLSLGSGTGASTTTRYMKQGSDQLGYALYRNAGRTQLWGTNTGTDTLAGTGTGSAATIDVFGRVPMQQAAPAGGYSDTIVVTVSW